MALCALHKGNGERMPCKSALAQKQNLCEGLRKGRARTQGRRWSVSVSPNSGHKIRGDSMTILKASYTLAAYKWAMLNSGSSLAVRRNGEATHYGEEVKNSVALKWTHR